MKFDHLIKHNGTMYPAGTDVPVGKTEECNEEKVICNDEPKEKAKRGRNTKKA